MGQVREDLRQMLHGHRIRSLTRYTKHKFSFTAPLPALCTDTHTHTCTHTPTHIHTHICTHAHIHTRTHAHWPGWRLVLSVGVALLLSHREDSGAFFFSFHESCGPSPRPLAPVSRGKSPPSSLRFSESKRLPAGPQSAPGSSRKPSL